MVEFLLAFVPVFICFLGCVQLVFLAAADLVVRHSAVTGVRAAIVVLADDPRYYADEHVRTIAASGKRMAAIRTAVSYPLAAIAPDANVAVQIATGEATGLADELGSTPATRLLSAFALYDALSTAVTFPAAARDATLLPEDKTVTLQVTYLFHCGVPLVAAMFCSTYGSMFAKQKLARRGKKRAHAAFDDLEFAPNRTAQQGLLLSSARFRVFQASATLPSQYARYLDDSTKDGHAGT